MIDHCVLMLFAVCFCSGEFERARQFYDAALDMIANRTEWPAGTYAPTQKEVNTWDGTQLLFASRCYAADPG